MDVAVRHGTSDSDHLVGTVRPIRSLRPRSVVLRSRRGRVSPPPACSGRPHLTVRDVSILTVSRRAGQGTVAEVSERSREVLGEVDHPCHSCGAGCAIAIETRPVMRFRDRFRSNTDRRVRHFEMCLDCGTTVRVLPVKPRPVGGGEILGRGFDAL